MKVLRAIGGFFAKIGRWIANTAWIQPLLIVGGIFAVIFSIPYIKTAIEEAQVDNTDYDYAYYTSSARALDLKEGSTSKRSADKLFSALESGKQDDLETINKNFGKKFLVSFIEKGCSACNNCVEAYKEFAKSSKDFKLYTIVMDKKASSSDDDPMAKRIFNDYNQFFVSIASTFGEDQNRGEYVLYKNISSTVRDTYYTNLDKFDNATSPAGEGLDTPFTFMYDYDKVAGDPAYKVQVSSVTAVFFDFTAFIEGTTNKVTKKLMLDDIWNYKGVLDPNPDVVE